MDEKKPALGGLWRGLGSLDRRRSIGARVYEQGELVIDAAHDSSSVDGIASGRSRDLHEGLSAGEHQPEDDADELARLGAVQQRFENLDDLLVMRPWIA